MRRLRTLTFGLILAVPALAPAVAGSAPACAAEASGSSHAALVVNTGAQTTTYCVALDASSVTGIHLVQLAGSQFGLQYQLGFGGQAVCQLAGVGASGGDCFGSYPDFWGYWHGNGSGGWSWAGTGAGSASIGNGDMEGWVWGSGDSGTTHAAPPVLGFDDVCKDSTPTPTPPPSPGGGSGSGGDGNGGGTGGHGGGNGGTAGGTGSGSGATSTPGTDASASPHESSGPKGSNGDDAKDRSPQVDPSTGEVVAASPVTALAAGVTDDAGGGPPIGALLALVAVAALGAGGWFLRRRQIARGGG
ncbi:MAG: hypothetical protein ACHQY1_01275 [Myxococcota bacterium]